MITIGRAIHHLRRHGTDLAAPDTAQPAGRTHRVGCEPLFSFSGRPGGITVDSRRTVYVSDADSATIWQVSPDGAASPLIDRTAVPTRLYSPTGMASAPDGSLVVADATAHRICSVGLDGSIQVLAGGVSGFRDGPAAQSAFRFPRSVAVGGDGAVFVADAGNDRIRRIAPDGQVSTLAGSIFDYGDGAGIHARFRRPSGIALDSAGVLYVADTGNNAVRRLLGDGEVTTVAGGPPGGHADGSGRAAGLRWPVAVSVGDDGWLWVADYGNSTVRLIDPTGGTSTVFEIPGLGWPSAVAALPGRRAVVAGSALDDRHDRRGCLMTIGEDL